jgi:hypothetical protein
VLGAALPDLALSRVVDLRILTITITITIMWHAV